MSSTNICLLGLVLGFSLVVSGGCDRKVEGSKRTQQEGAGRPLDANFICWGALTKDESRLPTEFPAPEGEYFGTRGPVCDMVGGKAFCFGNRAGDFGGATERTEFGKASGFRQVAFGLGHTCGLREDGTVKCWGRNLVGELGIGEPETDETDRDEKTVELKLEDGKSETKLPKGSATAAEGDVTGLDNVVEVALGASHGCARTSGKEVWCWGSGTNGELGDGEAESRPYPVRVAGIDDAEQLAVVGSWACVVRSAGKVACWGTRKASPAAADEKVVRKSPETYEDLSGIEQIVLRANGSSSHIGFARDESGAVFRFEEPSQVRKLGALNSIELLSTGLDHTCGLATKGGVRCWGSNEKGQLGLEKAYPRGIPRVPGVDGATRIVSGRFFSCADTR